MLLGRDANGLGAPPPLSPLFLLFPPSAPGWELGAQRPVPSSRAPAVASPVRGEGHWASGRPPLTVLAEDSEGQPEHLESERMA